MHPRRALTVLLAALLMMLGLQSTSAARPDTSPAAAQTLTWTAA